jgi:hypothetical protein
MKKFFVPLFILIFLIAAGAAVFLATFDAERYKPLLVQRLEKILGNAVGIGRISLGWEGGISIQLKDLRIARDASWLEDPAVSLERLSARVRFWPLLKKRIEVQSIVIERPRLQIAKQPDGSFGIENMNPRPSVSSAAVSQESFVSPVFSMDVIAIEKGEIIYLDRFSQKPLEIAVRQIDAVFKNVVLEEPVDFEIQAALLTDRPNLELKGRLKIMSPSGPYRLDDFKAAVDLKGLKTGEIKDAEGVFGLNIDRLEMGPKGFEDLSASFGIKEARLVFSSLSVPLERLNAQGMLTKNEIELNRLSANLAGGEILAKTKTLGYLSSSVQSALAVELKALNLEEFFPSSGRQEPGLKGKFSLGFNGAARGLSWSAISQTLTGAGEMTLTEAMITNVNVLKMVLSGLSKVPGVSETLQARLPAHYYPVLEKPYTVIYPVGFPLRAQNGTVFIPNIKIGFEGFDLYGQGQMDFSKALDFKAWLVLAPDLSQILVTSVPQMRYVADNYGNVVVPVHIQSDGRKIKVTPDMDYVLQRVLVTKGQELLSDVLGKGLGKSQSASADPSQQSLLSSLFQ